MSAWDDLEDSLFADTDLCDCECGEGETCECLCHEDDEEIEFCEKCGINLFEADCDCEI